MLKNIVFDNYKINKPCIRKYNNYTIISKLFRVSEIVDNINVLPILKNIYLL